jgi:hypothetical protein
VCEGFLVAYKTAELLKYDIYGQCSLPIIMLKGLKLKTSSKDKISPQAHTYGG